MGAYKKLNKQDVYTTTYTAHKPWAIGSEYSGSTLEITSSALQPEFSSYGITRITATGSYSSSLTHLYYPSKSEDTIVSHSYDYYYQTTLYNSESRNFNNDSVVISIPRDLYGTNIHPSSLRVGVLRLHTQYVDEYYVNPNYILDPVVDVEYIVDDGEGGVYLEGTSPKQYLGDIIYSHGLVILTRTLPRTTLPETTLKNLYIDTMQFKSSLPIYTHTYQCKIRESEFNSTYNKSAQTSSLTTVYDNEGGLYSTASRQFNGQLKNQVTGSVFQPYITTVGLYNDANELIAIAKMGQPIPKSANTEMVIVVKIDT